MYKPDFIIAGAAKSGTTSLIKYLSYSNEVFCLTTLKNGHEVNFFSKNLKKGYKWYSSLFSSSLENQIIGEKSVSYMENKHVPKRILEFCPNVKLIFILRNPIDRAYSQYKSNCQRGIEFFPFSKAIKMEKLRKKIFKNTYLYIERGEYIKFLKKYYSLFNKDQIYVLLFEEFINSPKKELKKTK